MAGDDVLPLTYLRTIVCVRQILNLFLALLISSFSAENMKKQRQDSNSEGDDNKERQNTSDNQMSAAYERLRRWAKFFTARVGSLRRRRAPETDDTGINSVTGGGGGGGGGLKATSTTDTACDLAATVSADSIPACRLQPAVLVDVDCRDRQVERTRHFMLSLQTVHKSEV